MEDNVQLDFVADLAEPDDSALGAAADSAGHVFIRGRDWSLGCDQSESNLYLASMLPTCVVSASTIL